MTSHLDHGAGHRATGAGAAPPRRMRVVGVDIESSIDELSLDGYEGALIIAFRDDRPVGELIVQRGPERTDPSQAEDSLTRRMRRTLRPAVSRDELEQAAWAAVGRYWEALPRPAVTVAVCTRDRPAQLERCLRALSALDPAPADVVVVDNAGRVPVRPLVERFGFRCVEEPRAGLNNARRRAMAECTTDFLIYTDDDCLPHERWLDGLRRHFSDPMVAAVSGLGCPYTLDSEAQVAFETAVGFSKGYRTRRVDWRSLAPVSAGNVGAGNNMAFRLAALEGLDPFPRELDAGTPTASGGDLYALAVVLASGHRVVYEPSQLVWHDHRADMPELRRVMRGYGRGIGAMLARSVVADHELQAFRAMSWPLHHLLVETVRMRRGERRRIDVVGGLELVRGWVESPVTWVRSMRRQGVSARRPVATAAPPRPHRVIAARIEGGPPDVSVVIPTLGTRPRSLAATLSGLAEQTLDRDRFEVILVPNGPAAGDVGVLAGVDRTLPQVEASLAAARNAGAGAARGDLVVFLDDDIVPEPAGLEAFLRAHRSGPGVLLGPYPPAGLGGSLAEQMAGRWWNDHFTRQARAGHRFSFTDLAGGWMALPARLMEETGGFDTSFDHRSRREDWEFACRVLADGVPFVAVPDARASHHHEITVARLLRDKLAEGYADVLLADRHPAVWGDLHLGRLATPERVGTPAWRAAVAAGERALGPVAGPVHAALRAAEATGSRFAWQALFRRVSGAVYCVGVQRALDDGHPLPAPSSSQTVVDLAGAVVRTSDIAIGEVSVRRGGAELAAFRLPDGQWDGELIVERLLEREEALERFTPAA
ncbi:glycosyltransferase [Miltoncostaea oceani]|uniref:glycosyltransferase n=1 Tax=Miltoncostaea oceani TaxID=2843216 RepID=UPI001C3E3CF2|nr:glycosyltransferase [Miltoncostaea oceani]